MKKTCIVVTLALLADSPCLPAGDGIPSVWRRSARPYEEHPIAPVDMSNSARIHQLLRSGNIYLSLTDAIALAIENNLDIELQRYTPPSADTEVQRAKGGGQLRGLLYNLAEVPVGVGGPDSPLVTNAASPTFSAGSVPTNPSELGALAEAQDNLSVQGALPLSTGPAIPQFDPALVGQLNWAHQTTPENEPAAYGTNALTTNTTLADVGYTQGFGPGTQLNVAFNNQRQTLNSIQSSYSPYTTSNLGFTITQPLLRIGFEPPLHSNSQERAKNRRASAPAATHRYGVWSGSSVYGSGGVV